MKTYLKIGFISCLAVIIAGVVIKVIHYPSYSTVCKRLLLFEITQGQAFEQLIKNGERRVPAEGIGFRHCWWTQLSNPPSNPPS